MTSAPSTPAATKGRRRKEARPAELIEAALDVFTERGFAGARMEDIAARAGVSKGTIYLYFPSKLAVFEALVRSAIVPNLERAELLAAAGNKPVLDVIALVYEHLLLVIDQGRVTAIPKLVISEAGNFPELARFYHQEVVQRGLSVMQRLLARGMERGEIRRGDPQVLAKLCFAPVLMAALWRQVFTPVETAPGLDPELLLRTHLDLMTRALATAAPSPAAEAST